MGDFFPYHPLRFRLWLSGGALVALGLAGWAVFGVLQDGGPRDILRAGLSFGLCGAMALTVWRLRPREGWGVKVTPLSVLISKPRGGLIEVPWSAVREVRRFGDDRDTLGLWLDEQQRVLVPAHLFARRADFEALAAAIDERKPRAQAEGAQSVH